MSRNPPGPSDGWEHNNYCKKGANFSMLTVLLIGFLSPSSRKFPSGTVLQVWANFWVLVIHILPLWPMSATSLQDKCHHSIIWSLVIRLKLCLLLAMIPCLMIFVTIFSTPIVISIFMMMKSPQLTLLFTIYILLMKFDWVNMSTKLVVVSMKNGLWTSQVDW